MIQDEHIIILWKSILNMNRELKVALQFMNEKTNISYSGTSVLFRIHTLGEMKMLDIANFLGITLGSTTSMVDKLERDGLVRRVRKETDRRSIFVVLTEFGNDKVQEIRRQLSEQATVIFGEAKQCNLSEMEFNQLVSSIETISRLLANYNNEPTRK